MGILFSAKPALPESFLANSGVSNGDIINGVANFWQPTPPLTRVGGSALVDRDIWYDSSSGNYWFRRGIYWVSPTLYHTQYPRLFTVFPASPFVSFTRLFAQSSFVPPKMTAGAANALVHVEDYYRSCSMTLVNANALVLDNNNFFYYGTFFWWGYCVYKHY